MSFWQITLGFLGLLAVVGISFLIHSSINRARIRKNFRELAPKLNGTVRQPGLLSYPTLEGTLEGRAAQTFFHVTKAKRISVLYVASRISVSASYSALLLKDNYFKPFDTTRLAKDAGKGGLKANGFLVWSNQQDRVKALIESPAFLEKLRTMEDYPTIVMGPDSIIMSKPYDSLEDTAPEQVMKNYTALFGMALLMESTR